MKRFGILALALTFLTGAATVSFAVILHDTDAAPGKGTMDVTHWILWNVPATDSSLPASIAVDSSPDGIVQGKNVAMKNGFQPPCPPPGATPHHYVFELYALDTNLDVKPSADAFETRANVMKAIQGHILAKAVYGGLFRRPQ